MQMVRLSFCKFGGLFGLLLFGTHLFRYLSISLSDSKLYATKKLDSKLIATTDRVKIDTEIKMSTFSFSSSYSYFCPSKIIIILFPR